MKQYPIAPLIAAIERAYPDFDDRTRSKTLGYQPRWMAERRGRSDGVREDVADEVAIRLGLHPCDIWPTWFDDALEGDGDWTSFPTCGTEAGAQTHRRRGEKPCLDCAEADAIRKREWRRAQKAKKEAAA